MKNIIGIILVGSILLFAVIGCSKINPLSDKGKTANANTNASNKTLADKGVDTVVGEEKIGIPECDEVMDLITAEANNPDDNVYVKAGKAVFFNTIKEGIRKNIEESKGDKVEIAKKCTEYKKELDKYKAEEEKKKGE
jgi:predicted aconitase